MTEQRSESDEHVDARTAEPTAAYKLIQTDQDEHEQDETAAEAHEQNDTAPEDDPAQEQDPEDVREEIDGVYEDRSLQAREDANPDDHRDEAPNQ